MSHNVVALVSGGKDSCYSIQQCVHYGHKMIALANLQPVEDKDEMDSYMYQTVGWNVISAYADCLGLPIYRRIIRGQPVEQKLAYNRTLDDEVEDLFQLLLEVKEKHPEITAVCSGAILSDYQRLRVENVCSRLGLTSLGFLWRKDQKELINSMIDSGMEIILVKIAALGLTERHLGKNVRDLLPEFYKLNQKYGSNICGEGGEYESMTLDSPLFIKKIVIDHSKIVIHSDDAFSPVAYLQIIDFHLEDKPEVSPLRKLFESTSTAQLPAASNQEKIEFNFSEDEIRQAVKYSISNKNKYLCCSASIPLGDSAYQTQTIFQFLQKLVKEKYSVDIQANCTFVHLYIRNMGDFLSINKVFSAFFTAFQPPARECVSVGGLLEDNVHVLIEFNCIADHCISPKSVLHVQSISEWAPACIGPYSQASMAGGFVQMAGIIGLFPATMNVVQQEVELSQCLANISAILPIVKSSAEFVFSITVYFISSYFSLLKESVNTLTAFFSDNALFRFVEIHSLPKNSSVELQLLTYNNDALNSGSNVISYDSDSDDDFSYSTNHAIFENSANAFIEYFTFSALTLIQYHCSSFVDCSTLLDKLTDALLHVNQSWPKVNKMRIFYSSKTKSVLDLQTKFNEEHLKDICINFIPVANIYYNSLDKPAVLSIECYLWNNK